jgi:septum formation protein
LLAEAGYDFEVLSPGESEDSVPFAGEPAPRWVQRLAHHKAATVAPHVRDGIVVACDTVAECGGQILGKPQDRDHARQMLCTLRGQVHRVYSGLCLWRRPDDRTLTDVAVSVLELDNISDQALEDYLDSGAWQGKAGAFGYQDRLGWIRILDGSESNVVGLPLELLAEMLSALNAPP